MAAHRALQLSDLRGLLRILCDSGGPRATLRIPSARQLQSSLHFRILFGVLDALAHLTFKLAADLPIHPSWREPARRVQNLPKPDDCHGPWWAVARGRA